MKPPYISPQLMNSVGLTLSAQTSYPGPQGNMVLLYLQASWVRQALC